MRIRKKKNVGTRIEAVSAFLIRDIGAFESLVNVHMEIGCGKGAFICTLAKMNPDIEFIAVEKSESVLVIAMERAAKEEIKNVRFYRGDVMSLEKVENSHFASRIYLNFSDPWPRERHLKRRLTAEGFLNLYKKLLTFDGSIHMKTDNAQLFDFSLASFLENGFSLSDISRDLHKSGAKDNIMTEYEKNFVSQGLPIYALKTYIKDIKTGKKDLNQMAKS